MKAFDEKLLKLGWKPDSTARKKATTNTCSRHAGETESSRSASRGAGFRAIEDGSGRPDAGFRFSPSRYPPFR